MHRSSVKMVATPPTGPSSAKPDFTHNEIDILETARTILRNKARDAVPLQSWNMLEDYLSITAALHRVEVLRVLFLDRKNRLIEDKAMSSGTIDHVPVYVREVIRGAILLDASALIIAHNHPSGDPSPSDCDIAMTREIIAACRPMSITVHDHVIVGYGRQQNVFSMRSAGLLDDA